MPEEPLHQPHDKFFRTAFSNPETAAAFLQAYLERELVALVDWSSLHPEPGTFVDAHMRASTADLLFTAKVHGEDAHFYFLCEHQSSEDGLMALRVLAYMVRIWTEETRGQNAPARLTPIIPVVVAQDNKAWKTSAKFHDLFKLPPQKWEEVRAYTPDFAFRLLELVEHPFESLKGTPDGRLALRVLKAQPVGELLGDPVWEASLLKEVSRELLETLIRYTHNEDVDKEQFWLRLKTLPRADLDPEAMTLADKFREEGREEGLEQGRLDGVVQMLSDVLTVRFGSVPSGLIEALGTVGNVEKLRELNRHALVCSSLEEFTAFL